MSEYYSRHNRYERLSQFRFAIDGVFSDYENYFNCVCSRIYIRDAFKIYYNEKEDVSESDAEVIRDHPQTIVEDQSHVHFSVDTSDNVKYEKDEGASCYCSASHTDNYCSTDEHDPAQLHGTMSHALQPSDSGADLTYQDCHSDHTSHDKLEKMDQDFPKYSSTEVNEDYLSEDTWEKFWAVNGERLIWASWIEKYSDYINPSYLDENNDLMMDENHIPKQHSSDQIFDKEQTDVLQKNVEVDESIRERKFSYDSKVNPYKKSRSSQSPIEKSDKNNELTSNKDDTWLPIGRRRSCSEHDRMLSPRTLAGTDSMTNVTKITLSSYDVTSSHVTSESTPTDDYSVSSSTSDDPSNDQTRIANIDENTDLVPLNEIDSEEYWQYLWKKHFGEQYAMHYANYVEAQNWHYANYVEESTETKDLPSINVEMVIEKKTEEKATEVECENSEGNSQEMPSVIEVQAQIDKINIEEKVTKSRKRNKKASNNYIRSVGVLLQNLLMEEQRKSDQNEVVEGSEGEGSTEKTKHEVSPNAADGNMDSLNAQQSVSNSNYSSYNYDDEEDDDPPEETRISLKRSHELDYEESTGEKVIKTAFEIMGFCVDSDNMPKGKLIYKNRLTKLRPPRYKRGGAAKKTYFDDDGNPYSVDQTQEVQEREMQTDEDCPEVKLDVEKSAVNLKITDATENISTPYDVQNRDVCDNEATDKDVTAEASTVPFPADVDNSFNDVQDSKPESKKQRSEELQREGTVPSLESSVDFNRRRRGKRYDASSESNSKMPPELRGDSRMGKYWKRRHSLFHRFDEGIKLDFESWFSVTPESVAAHIADKCSGDVVVDAFCGAGGNTIQFAKFAHKVIAIDIDPVKVELAKHNARVYGVEEKIDFIVGDFFELAASVTADVVFLSPPWGGLDYNEKRHYNIETMLKPRPASELMRVAQTISSNVVMYLPRTSRTDQLVQIAREHHSAVEVEQSYLDKRFVAITAYFYK